MLLDVFAGDRVHCEPQWPAPRSGLGVLFSVPDTDLGLSAAPGNLLVFVAFETLGGRSMFVDGSTVYSAIQDQIEPSLRGTATALD